MTAYNNPVTTRVKGRNNGGKTSTYYWQCSYNKCGCKKEWRISTNLYTSDVVEEESVGEHSCHELLQRNGGRGLSHAHVAIIQESYNNGVKKPKNLVHLLYPLAYTFGSRGNLKFSNFLVFLINYYSKKRGFSPFYFLPFYLFFSFSTK